MNSLDKDLPWALIPAFQPDQRLTGLVEGLAETKAFARIIVVDDGSSPDRGWIFDSLKSRGDVALLRQAVNRGKGQALKTGLNHFLLESAPGSPGLVCCDADGQHLAGDVAKVAQKGALEAKFALGVRVFGPNTPFRSKLGNTVTSLVFGFFTGYRLGDTQTGLRFIPRDKAGFFLRVPYDRFDYEFAALVNMTNEFPGQTIQVPIETVYLDANASSHYRSIRDSLTIGAIFVKFFFLSISTTVLDYLVFSLAYYHTREILCSFVIARIASILYNFSLSRYLVFKVKTNLAKQLAKYVVLVAAFMCLSWGLTELLFRLFGLYVVLGKLMSEAGLFLLSWFVQRRFIFTPKGNKTATR